MVSTVKDRIVAIAVTDEALRLAFLPKYLGRRSVRFETDVYCWLSRLSPVYKGGVWNFFELSNAGFYMAPTRPERMRSICERRIATQSLHYRQGPAEAERMSANSESGSENENPASAGLVVRRCRLLASARNS